MSKTRIERIAITMTQANIDSICELLDSGAITREDYRRACDWLMGIILVYGERPDSTLEVLRGLEGKVTHAQRQLLRIGFANYSLVIDHMSPDTPASTLAYKWGGILMLPFAP